MYTVRRHLGKGANFMHYQIRGHVTDAKQGDIVEYVNPKTHSIVFKGCHLHNKFNQSAKILGGASKAPCAWLIAESYDVVAKQSIDKDDVHLRFNPRISANWELVGLGIADDMTFDQVVMKEAKLYTK